MDFFFFAGAVYVLYYMQVGEVEKCLPPVIGMFLLQLTLLYVLSKQWSSLGAKHSNTTEDRQHARHALDVSHRRSSLQRD